MTVLMSGVNMFAMAKVMQIVLGWDINCQHLGFVADGRYLCRSRRFAVRDL